MKNPAVAALTVVAVVAAVGTILLIALTAAGVGRTFNAYDWSMEGGIPLWAPMVTGGVAVLAAIAALVVWGLSRGPAQVTGREADGSGQ